MNTKPPQKMLHLKIEGRVQGVGFRYATVRAANDLNLAGWVKNRNDGAVEVYANGEQSNLDQFYQWCQHGPTTARVIHCSRLTTTEDDQDAVESNSFKIVY